MIFCVCPNPSIDITVYTDELILRALNRTSACVTDYAGKAINVAKAASELGTECCAGGFIFSDDRNKFESVLSKSGISSEFVCEIGSVRTNLKIIEKDGSLTELNGKGAPVSQKCRENLLNKIKEISAIASVTVISGSLPENCDAQYYGMMAGAVNKKSKLIIDTEGEKLISAMKQGVFLIKPNKYELECVIKKKINSFDDMKSACKSMLNMGTQTVLLSLGSDGAFIYNKDEAFYAKSPNVEVSSSVGAGDSMIGACTIALERGCTLSEILRYSVCAGSSAVMSKGTGLFKKSDFDSMFSKIEISRV